MRLRDLTEYKGKYPQERVQIFVDGSNLYHALKSECGRVDLDYLKFAEMLTNGRKLIRLNLYVATFDSHKSPKEAREQQRFIDDIQKLPYITVKHKMLNYKDGIPYEKGIDILIAVDMVTQALWNYYDTGILVSGDGDFAPMLSRIKNAGKQDKPKPITIGEFRKQHCRLMKGQVAYATLKDQDRALRFFEKFIGSSTKLTAIKPTHAEAFIADRLYSGVSTATVNKDIRTLKSIFNLAIEPRGYLADGQNPFAKISQRRRTPNPLRYVSVKEYKKLLEKAPNLWWKSFISLAYVCGLRKSEIENLTWRDIDFDQQLVFVQAKKPTDYTIEWEPKDHENREVPLPENTARMLVNLQSICSEGAGYVFISPQRFKIICERIKTDSWTSTSETLNNILRNFEKICTRAQIKKCTLHDLRRSAITNWAQRLPIQAVQQLAGHSNITTTRKYYLSVRNEDMKSARETISTMLEAIESD